MKDISMLRMLVAAIAALLGLMSNEPSCAQGFPSKPITIVVPFGPGSPTDTVARIVGQRLGVALNQSILIETKPGANGAIAATYVARAAADGHTLLMGTNSTHSAAPSLNKTIAYDPVKDFSAIARIGSFNPILVSQPDLPVRSVADLIAYGKANPGKLSIASGNTAGIVTIETLKSLTGIDVTHVPYRSVPPALNDVLGGRVSMAVAEFTTALPHVRAGTLRGLAVTRGERSALVPEIPTLQEAGLTGLQVDPWAGLFAPANTPGTVVTRLNAEVRKIVDNPEIKGQIGALGFDAFSSTSEELGEFVKVQLVRWTKMIKDAGIEPE
jgi:tripartite-type tricarboxylate transporter receptor subunit TctC